MNVVIDLDIVETLLDSLKEAHQAEINAKHNGDKARDCSYCKIIKRTVRALEKDGQ